MVGEKRPKGCEKCDCLHYPWSSQCNRCCFHLEGVVVRSSKDASSLTVRESSGMEKTVQYDRSTKWVSQEHGSKTVNDIDAKQLKDDDRVLIQGTYDDNGGLHGALIAKRPSK